MSYNLVVIGAGPGGYVCAIRAAQLGMKVAVVEKRKTLGGTCLNIGCIPSKALLHASEMFEEAGHAMAPLGVVVGPPKLDLGSMMKHKDDNVAANVNGVAFLFKKNKIDRVTGEGRIAAPGKVVVKGEDGNETTLEAKAIVIATGSDVARLAGVEIDEKTVVSSTGALSLPKVPKKLIVVGAGVIGLELGSVWRRLGAEVTVIEFLDRILPGMDGEVAKQFQRMLEKQGFAFHLAHKLAKVEKAGGGVKATIEPTAGGDAKTIDADVVLVAIGRRPYTQNLGLEALGVAMDRGMVVVDKHFAAKVPGVYAIGDVIRGPMLAHKAQDEGVALAEILGGSGGPRELRRHPGRRLHQPRDRRGRQDRRRTQGRGRRLQGGKVPLHRQRPGAGDAPHRGLRQDPRRRRDRPGAGGPYRRLRRRRDDPRGGGADGIRRLGRGPRPHLPRPSDDVGSGEGSRARGRQARDSRVSRALEHSSN